jgi:eukaryotic-like serine/threonine-protein kinase
MNSEQFKKIEELFFELRPLGPRERDVALDSRCPDDADVRAEVAKLLVQDAGGADELSRLGRDFGREPSVEMTRQFIGQRVGCYEILDLIGQGGMGVIYRARDVRLSRPAALKAILPGAAHANAARLERLRREARVLASISHPNIATIYGLEESHDTLFIAMEFIEGKTLSQRLGRSAMPVPDALIVCEEIAAGVEAAHEAGVIHRDLKPGNVMFTADGAVKVLDFGLARELKHEREPALDGDETRNGTLTRHGSFFGTPAYMSPEQARGEALDRRSDIFSFGSILFRCLTGRPAFDGEGDAETIDGILNREPDWSRLPASTPPALVKVLRRCLAKNPDDRYRHIGDVRLELREMIDERAWEPRNDSKARRERRRRRLTWVLVTVSLIALALAAVLPRRNAATSIPLQAAAQRLDLALPENAPQRDLERTHVALARDGRFIIAPFQTASGQELWIREFADGAWRRIDGTLGAHRPFISPDGQWVGFHRDGNLYKRRLSGGDSIRVVNTTNWYGAAWGAGDAIVYTPTWGDPIHAVSRPGAAPVVVTRLEPDKTEYSHLSPTMVPGGKWVLYHVWHGREECSLQATEMATGAKHTVIGNATTARVASTPRGPYLLFERASIIFAAPFDAATATVTGPEQAIADGVMNDGTRFSAYFDVADDGTLAYIPGRSFEEESRLSYINADGTTSVFNDDRLSFTEPRFSMDGKKLSVATKGKLYQVRVYDLERQTSQAVLTGGDTVAHVFSPDGNTLACTINRDGGYGIYLVSLIDGTMRRVTPPGADYQSDIDWSHDGKYITFAMSPTEGAPRDVWLVDAAATDAKPRAVIATAGADVQAGISPDGRWVCYASDVSGRQEVYLAAFPAGDRIRQLSANGGGEQPVWAPDGKSLFYIAPQGLVSIGISPDGVVAARPTVVYDKPFGQSDPIARDYTVASDGRPFIVEPSERRPGVNHLCVVTNWYQLLK